MAPISFGVEISQRQFVNQAAFDAGGVGSDLAADEFESAPRRFVVEQNARRHEHAVGFAVVSGQMKAGHFRHAVGRTRREWRSLGLRRFGWIAEHLAGTGEINFALRRALANRFENEMRAVDVRAKRRKRVFERIADEALGRQVVQLVGLDFRNGRVQAGKAFQAGGVKLQAIENAR